jgi:hypothetical protein
MPRRLALSLMIAWLAWTTAVFAQAHRPEGFPLADYQGPYYQDGAPVYYHQQPTWEHELLPSSRVNDYDWDAATDLAIGATLGQAWYRAEYLWLNYRDPAEQIMGAPTLLDTSGTFPAIDRITGVRTNTNGTLIDQAPLDNQGINGMRLTMGIPTQIFNFEASVFAMGQSTSHLRIDPYLDTNSFLNEYTIPVIPLTRNGAPSSFDFILFDQGVDIKYRANLQGTDAKLVFPALTPNVPVEFSPVVGFNYLHVNNRLSISGVDDASLTNHLIDSRADNHIFGPELGMRIEARSKWVTLGFEPKLTFGINRILNRVITQQIFDPTEANRLFEGTQTRFSPIIDLSTSARIRLAENLHLSLGYQFMAMTNVSQSERNIVWDSAAVLTAPPLIRLDMHRRDFWVQGINVGLQWQF